MKKNKIPSLFPHNHASNLLSLSNGDLLCAWFGGSCEGKPDISIQCSRLKSTENEWSNPKILSDDAERSEQNPILFEIEPGVIWLIYTAQIGIHQDTAVVRWRKSEDYGETWSKIEDLFDEKGIFVRNPPIVLDDGDIILPAYYCLKSETGFLGEDYSVIKHSKDKGRTWSETLIPQTHGLVHMSIVKISENHLLGFFRSRQADAIYKTESTDGGYTWCIPEPSTLPNNNASIQCIKLKDNTLAMVFNDVNKAIAPPKVNRPPWFDKKDMDEVSIKETESPSAVWGVRRSPLTLAISMDNGESWERVKVIETHDDLDDSQEFSYPSITQTKNGDIYIAYTYLRKYIKVAMLTSSFE
jgi:predicted neuraminidase